MCITRTGYWACREYWSMRDYCLEMAVSKSGRFEVAEEYASTTSGYGPASTIMQ